MKEYYCDADKIKVREKQINHDSMPIWFKFWIGFCVILSVFIMIAATHFIVKYW